MVTKQEQLEWLAHKYKTWPEQGATYLGLSVAEVGKFAIVNCHLITRQEWQQERDKMQKRNEYEERGELPPVGVPVELWVGGSFAYNCEFITKRKHHYVVWNLDADRPDASDYMNSEFRPLRTEREKAIDELNNMVGDIEKYPTWRDAIAGIIDAGYHK